MRVRAFTLVELLVVVAIITVLGACLTGAGWKVYEASSLAISANNIRQLAAGGSAYLGDNNHLYWPYRKVITDPARRGVEWWFGYESAATSQVEGSRVLRSTEGPLGEYVPAGIHPDPSFKFTGKALKPKFRQGYLGVAYNINLGGGWGSTDDRKRYWELADPSKVVVFITSAQVNVFQRPASAANPMIEEFYGLDEKEVAVHFRHHGFAMASFANGSAGFLPMDESTRDLRAPHAQIGRLAPKGDKKYLE